MVAGDVATVRSKPVAKLMREAKAVAMRGAYSLGCGLRCRVTLGLSGALSKLRTSCPSAMRRCTHVYADKASGGKLHKGLRSQKPRRKRHLCGRDRRGQIPQRRPIGERPAHIEGRKQVGHWEGDTVIGARHSQAVVTVVERKSGYAKLRKVTNKTAELVSQAIEDVLKPLNARVKTLTVDNGKEFAYHQKVDQALGIQTYFADP